MLFVERNVAAALVLHIAMFMSATCFHVTPLMKFDAEHAKICGFSSLYADRVHFLLFTQNFLDKR